MNEIKCLKFVKLGRKTIIERFEDLIEIAKFWIDEGFDGVVFDRCFCGRNCGIYGEYYLKCGHYTKEPHVIKIYNDYCPECKKKEIKISG